MKNFAQALTAVLETRQAVAPSNDLVTSINNAKSHARALDSLFSSKAFAPVAKKLLDALAISKSSDNREEFIAVKVVVKLINAANAIAKAETGLFDPYSRVIIANLINLQSLSNKSALVSLSNSIVFTEDDQQQKLKNRYGCSAGTAGTQASSTRMMLRALDVCEVLKSKRGDSLTIKTNERAAMLVELFSGKAVALPETPVKAEKPTVKKPAEKAAVKADEKPAAKTTAKRASKPKAADAAPVADETPKAAVKPVKTAVKKPAAGKAKATAKATA